MHLTAGLSAETLQARREWQDIFKVAREKQQVSYKGNCICLAANLPAETAGQKGMAGYT